LFGSYQGKDRLFDTAGRANELVLGSRWEGGSIARSDLRPLAVRPHSGAKIEVLTLLFGRGFELSAQAGCSYHRAMYNPAISPTSATVKQAERNVPLLNSASISSVIAGLLSLNAKRPVMTLIGSVSDIRARNKRNDPSQLGARASLHKLMIILRRMDEGCGLGGTPPGSLGQLPNPTVSSPIRCPTLKRPKAGAANSRQR